MVELWPKRPVKFQEAPIYDLTSSNPPTVFAPGLGKGSIYGPAGGVEKGKSQVVSQEGG